MFLASAAFAADAVKDEKKAEPAKADAKVKAGDTKGEAKSTEKKADAKAKASDAKAKASDAKADAKSDEKKAATSKRFSGLSQEQGGPPHLALFFAYRPSARVKCDQLPRSAVIRGALTATPLGLCLRALWMAL